MIRYHLLRPAHPILFVIDEILGLDFHPADSTLTELADHPVLPEPDPDAGTHVVAVWASHDVLPFHFYCSVRTNLYRNSALRPLLEAGVVPERGYVA
jgi:hypothetical protein